MNAVLDETPTAPRENELGQPIGRAVPAWKAALPIPRTSLEGRFCRVEPLDVAKHAPALYEAISEDHDGSSWTYMGAGPFPTYPSYLDWMNATCLGEDPYFHAILPKSTGRPAGIASHLRIDPKNGVIEVGYIHYAPSLQRTAAATEAMYLLMRRAFVDLGYRRYEWKCDALNAPSRSAARRLGFTYEGTFRNAMIYKGRSRDTAWYSIVDTEWPLLAEVYEAWLAPSNFDAEGNQRNALGSLMQARRGASRATLRP